MKVKRKKVIKETLLLDKDVSYFYVFLFYYYFVVSDDVRAFKLSQKLLYFCICCLIYFKLKVFVEDIRNRSSISRILGIQDRKLFELLVKFYGFSVFSLKLAIIRLT